MRTFAIFIMIIANSSPYVLITPHSFWLRLISSLAAPVFIFLSGYSFFYSFKKNQDYKRKFLQAGYLLISAVLLDVVVWRILPFQTFDVLYLISIGIFINVLTFHFNWRIKLLLVIVCIYLSFTLQNYFGYRFILEDTNINSINWFDLNLAYIFQVKRVLIDGWFPIFPWLSVSILGSILAEKNEIIIHHKTKAQWISLLFFAIGIFALFNYTILQEERGGYLELFYPPDILYMLIAFSFIFLLHVLTINLSFLKNPKFNFLNLLGRNSLLIYLLHLAIISYLFSEYFKGLNEFTFSLLMVVFVIICFMIAFLSEQLSKRGVFKFLPSGIKSILGLK